MPDLLWFKWTRSKGGYSIRENAPTAYERRVHRRSIKQMKQVMDLERMDESEKGVLGMHRFNESFMNKEFEYMYLHLVPNGQETVEYEPLKDCSGLYKEFVNLKDSPEEYLRFANDYGLLSPHYEPRSFDFLSDWFTSRNRMEHMLEIWEKCNNDEFLGRFIEQYSGIFSSCSLVLGKSYEKTRISLYISPDDLKSAMVLQFFQVISSNLQVQGCAVCTKWFTFGAGTGRRKSAHYCSDRCRKAAFLERKRKSKA